MRYRRLGRSGPTISEITLGTLHTLGQRSDPKTSLDCVSGALDLGINSFDTADVYGGGEAESFLGAALAHVPRDRWIITTKCFFPTTPGDPTSGGLSRKHILESADNSLRRLRTDYLDVMLCHRFDPQTQVGETIQAIGDLIRQGKILHWGVSRWTPEQTRTVVERATAMQIAPPVCNQYFYNLLNPEIEDGLIEECERLGVGITAYSPLAQGVLTGKYLDRIPEGSRGADPELRNGMWDLKRMERVAQLKEIADQAKISLTYLALAWCLRQPAVSSVVIGASRLEQLRENVQALGVRLSEEILWKIQPSTAVTAARSKT